MSNGNHPPARDYFKFLGLWLEHPNFEQQVQASWVYSDSWQANVQRLTTNLKHWNRTTFGNIFQKKRRVLRRLEGIQGKLIQADNARLIAVRSQLWKECCQLVHHEEMYWFQQDKAKWVTLGDRNSRFIHQATLMRRSKNRIMTLQDDHDQWVYEDNALRALINQFFSQLYTTNGLPPDNLVTVCGFPEILPRHQHALGMAISFEETKGALFSMQNFKAPGPDGLHPVFFKSQWDTVGSSIHSFVQLCFENPMMVYSVNHTLLTLIPKCTEPAKAS